MTTEEIKKIIEKKLEKMRCIKISFLELKQNSIKVGFDCKEITSFIADINGWTYDGIQLNTEKGTKLRYEIIFKKQ